MELNIFRFHYFGLFYEGNIVSAHQTFPDPKRIFKMAPEKFRNPLYSLLT
jgi:hypothetical protein